MSKLIQMYDAKEMQIRLNEFIDNIFNSVTMPSVKDDKSPAISQGEYKKFEQLYDNSRYISWKSENILNAGPRIQIVDLWLKIAGYYNEMATISLTEHTKKEQVSEATRPYYIHAVLAWESAELILNGVTEFYENQEKAIKSLEIQVSDFRIGLEKLNKLIFASKNEEQSAELVAPLSRPGSNSSSTSSSSSSTTSSVSNDEFAQFLNEEINKDDLFPTKNQTSTLELKNAEDTENIENEEDDDGFGYEPPSEPRKVIEAQAFKRIYSKDDLDVKPKRPAPDFHRRYSFSFSGNNNHELVTPPIDLQSTAFKRLT